MDIELLHTFLAIAGAGTLSRAAVRLHVTQASTSARLQTLEAAVGQQLFVRNKQGARLTDAGRNFMPFATEIVRTWENARREMQSQRTAQMLNVGGEYSLWSALLLDWLVALRMDHPQIELHVRVEQAATLLDRVQRGELDMAILYSPHRRTGTRTDLILEEELVAVSTDPHCTQLKAGEYIHVDWGPDFTAQHNASLPELQGAGASFGLGPLALRYLLRVGGSGYFRTRAVEPHLRAGQLFIVPDAPKFSYSLYSVQWEGADHEMMTWAREQLASAARSTCGNWA